MVDRKIVKGHLFIAGAAVMWGLMAPLGKDAMSNVEKADRRHAGMSGRIIAMYNYMQPIVACTVSVLLGLGRLSVFHLVAIVLVFVGVYLAQMGTLPLKQDA